jgi:Geranylgeranyl pyrophosphate synthase
MDQQENLMFENLLYLEDKFLFKRVSLFEKFINKELEKHKNSSFYESLIYALRGGKRLRPIILFLTAETLGIPKEDYYPAAFAIELIHTVSLIHDDMLDREIYRRGSKAYYLVYGEEQAILVADYTLSLVLELTSRYKNKNVALILADTVKAMSEGQLLEVKLRNENEIKWEEYFKIIQNKTASLFEASSRIGATLATENEFYIETASFFGRYLGLAYQIYDDLRDWDKKEYVQKLKIENKKDFLNEKLSMYLDLSKRALNKLPQNNIRNILEGFIDLVIKT